MKPHIRMVRSVFRDTLLKWACYSPRCVGYGTTPHDAYNDWLVNRSGIRS